MSHKILVTDDDPVIQMLVSEYLKACGYEISLATSGSQCLEVAPEVKPDLILLDLFMPDMNGVDVLEVLRKNEATKEIPVVLLSANTERELAEFKKEDEANYYIQKPFEMKAMLAVVREILGE